MKEAKNPRILFFIAVGALFFLGGIFYMILAQNKSSKIRDISLLAANESFIVFNLDEVLYQTDLNGNVISFKSFESLGLERAVGDIELFENDIYITQGRSKNILKCSLPLDKCNKLLKVASTHKVAALDIAVGSSKILLTDSSSHKIYMYDKNKTFKGHLKSDEGYCYPNDIALKNGLVFVADTNNHQVLAQKLTNKNLKTIFTLKVKPKLNEIKYLYPIDLTIDEKDNLWVLLSDGNFNKGIIKAFSKSYLGQIKTNEAFLKIDSLVKPSVLTSGGGFVFIGDSYRYKIVKSDLYGNFLSFGDKSIKKEFKKFKAIKEYWEMQEKISYFGIAIGAFIFIFCILSILQNAKEPDVKNNIREHFDKFNQHTMKKPDSDGIIWLTKKRSGLRGLTFLFFLIVFHFFVFAVVLFYVGIKHLVIYISMLFLALLPAFIVLFIFFKAKNEQIGFKEKIIFLKNMFGGIKKANAKDVIFFFGLRSKVAIENFSTILFSKEKGGLGYDENELKTYFLPLLDDVKFQNEYKFMIQKLKSGDMNFILKMLLSIFGLLMGLWVAFNMEFIMILIDVWLS